MVDARRCGLRDQRLGPEGDPQSGIADHRQVVGAVSHHQGLILAEAKLAAQFPKRRKLGFATQHRLCNCSEEAFVTSDDELVAAVLIEAYQRRNLRGERRESPRHEASIGAVPAHGLHQGAPPGGERDPFRNHLVDHAGRKSCQQRNALTQCRSEFDLATHSALRDGSDARPLSDKVGQFVDAFLSDHGGIHVREQQELAPFASMLHHHVHGRTVQGGTQAVCSHAVVVFAKWRTKWGKRDIECEPRIEPYGCIGSRQHARGPPCNIVRQRLRRVGDQCGDMGHRIVGARHRMQRLRDNVQDKKQGQMAVLIAGPTASGKSALAMAAAERIGGIVINTDSMQVYRDLKVITARPCAADIARVPHMLYGHVDAAENYSVGRFLGDAAMALEAARMEGRTPVFTGGTGLYFKALIAGLAAIPPVSRDIRAAVRSKLEASGPAVLHAELARRDPAAAARLCPNDRIRIARALEVIEATGRSIADWQHRGTPPLLDVTRVTKIFLAPDRATLYQRIDARFDDMLSAGALDEVRALAARRLDPLLPAMKAHGVPWLIRHIAGDLPLAVAAAEAKKDTRHYAKRQFTWFRHQLADWPRFDPAVAYDALMRDIGR